MLTVVDDLRSIQIRESGEEMFSSLIFLLQDIINTLQFTNTTWTILCTLGAPSKSFIIEKKFPNLNCQHPDQYHKDGCVAKHKTSCCILLPTLTNRPSIDYIFA